MLQAGRTSRISVITGIPAATSIQAWRLHTGVRRGIAGHLALSRHQTSSSSPPVRGIPSATHIFRVRLDVQWPLPSASGGCPMIGVFPGLPAHVRVEKGIYTAA